MGSELIRIKALDQIENKNEWKVFNPIFELGNRYFDQAFSNRGHIIKKYYVQHYQPGKIEDTFEERFCSDLFPEPFEITNDFYLLRGELGTG